MSDQSAYTPPKIWTWNKENGGQFANINRPVAGPTHEKALPVGRHPLQLYSLATPNGVNVTVMLEELLALGHAGAENDAWLINIREGDHPTGSMSGLRCQLRRKNSRLCFLRLSRELTIKFSARKRARPDRRALSERVRPIAASLTAAALGVFCNRIQRIHLMR